MSIIRVEQEQVKASDEANIDVTVSELLGLWEFVVGSYEIDEAKQESRFHQYYDFFTYDHDRFPLPEKWHYQYVVIPAKAGIQSSFSGNVGIESYKDYG